MNNEHKEMLLHLMELHKKATPGEWLDVIGMGFAVGAIGDSKGKWLFQSWDKREENFPNADHNRAWVIALHNAFPTLLQLAQSGAEAQATISTQAAEIERLRGLIQVAFSAAGTVACETLERIGDYGSSSKISSIQDATDAAWMAFKKEHLTQPQPEERSHE